MFPLGYHQSIFRLGHLNSQEIAEFTKIFCLKLIREMLFQLEYSLMITASYHNIIHIYNKIDTPLGRVTIKHRVISFTKDHTKLLYYSAECAKPSSRRPFKTIKRLV